MDDIVSLGRKRLRERFFGDHPFRLGASGSLETVEAIEVDEVKSFYQSLLKGGNLTVAVSGQFEYDELSEKIEAILSQVPSGEACAVNTGRTLFGESGSFQESMDRQQVVVFHAFPCPGLKGEDYYVSEVMDELFSGMSSNLFERVREELSLAYFVRSSRIIGLDTGMFYLFSGTSPERYTEVLVELEREIERVQAGEIGEEELQRCTIRLKAARRMSMQTNSSCASQAAMNVAYGLPADDWRKYDERIDSIGIETLQAFAKKYFDRSKRVEFLIGAVDSK